MAGLLLSGESRVWTLLLVATIGNVLGALVNWLIGRYLAHWRQRRGFPLSARRFEQAERFYQRVGHWSLLLSWAPLIGDALTLAAGLLREPAWRFLALVTVAKGGRYLVVAGLTLGWA